MGAGLVRVERDVASAAFEDLRPGCAKAVLQQDAFSQTAVFRVLPGSGVPEHRHPRTHDLFFGVRGTVNIRYDDGERKAVFVLGPGGFCGVPPGVRHEVRNASRRREALFILVHAPFEGFETRRPA